MTSPRMICGRGRRRRRETAWEYWIRIAPEEGQYKCRTRTVLKTRYAATQLRARRSVERRAEFEDELMEAVEEGEFQKAPHRFAAWILQCAGVEQNGEDACTRCKDKKGPWTKCVAETGASYVKGACACCLYDKTGLKCSIYKGQRYPIPADDDYTTSDDEEQARMRRDMSPRSIIQMRDKIVTAYDDNTESDVHMYAVRAAEQKQMARARPDEVFGTVPNIMQDYDGRSPPSTEVNPPAELAWREVDERFGVAPNTTRGRDNRHLSPSVSAQANAPIAPNGNSLPSAGAAGIPYRFGPTLRWTGGLGGDWK